MNPIPARECRSHHHPSSISGHSGSALKASRPDASIAAVMAIATTTPHNASLGTPASRTPTRVEAV